MPQFEARTNASLTPQEVYDRLPQTVDESIKRPWAFDDCTLDKTTISYKKSNEIPKEYTAGTEVRFLGIIADQLESNHLRVEVPAHTMTLHAADHLDLRVPPSKILRYRQLSGLLLDMTAKLFSHPDATEDRHLSVATLVGLHGVEKPLSHGDRRGLLRGIVQEVEYVPHTDRVRAIHVMSGGLIRIKSLPSQPNAQFEKLGAAVAMRVFGGSRNFVRDRAYPVYSLREI